MPRNRRLGFIPCLQTQLSVKKTQQLKYEVEIKEKGAVSLHNAGEISLTVHKLRWQLAVGKTSVHHYFAFVDCFTHGSLLISFYFALFLKRKRFQLIMCHPCTFLSSQITLHHGQFPSSLAVELINWVMLTGGHGMGHWCTTWLCGHGNPWR